MALAVQGIIDSNTSVVHVKNHQGVTTSSAVDGMGIDEHNRIPTLMDLRSQFVGRESLLCCAGKTKLANCLYSLERLGTKQGTVTERPECRF